MNPVWLVATREMNAKMRSKAYLITTLILLLTTIAGPFVMKAINSSSDDTIKLVTTAEQSQLGKTFEAALATTGQKVTVTTATAAQAKAAVKAGTQDVFVLTEATGMTVFSQDKPAAAVMAVAAQINAQTALNTEITALGGDPTKVATAVASKQVTTTLLNDAGAGPDAGQLIVGMATGVLIFISIMSTGSMVATGVVQEKSSRVVEIILASIKPSQLLSGKLLGLCIVGTVQMLAIGLGAYLGVTLSGVELSFSLGASVLWLIVYYLIGYAVFAIMLGAAASLVSRLEDVGSVLTPFNFLMMAPYIYGISILPSGDSTVGQVGSMIPVFAPFIMPIRIAMGYAQPWEIAVSIGLSLVCIPLLVRLGARVFRNSVLRSGARVKWSEALKSA